MEIRRIRDGEGDTVGHLWDRMCREVPDGGPLTEQGRRNLSRMLDVSAWHRDQSASPEFKVLVVSRPTVRISGWLVAECRHVPLR